MEENLEISHLKTFLEEGREYLSSNLNFIILGGEQLLVKDKVLEIAKLGQKRKQEVIVSTNGTLIDSKFAQIAKKFNLIVQVSLEGAEKETNDKIRGKNSYERIIEGIKILVAHRVYTIISMVVHEGNFSEMDSFSKLGIELGVTEVRFIPLKIMGNARKNNLQAVSLTQIIKEINQIIQYNRNTERLFKRDIFSTMKNLCRVSQKRPYCGTGLNTILIDADGQIYPCPNHLLPEFSSGNIREQSFKEIWLSSSQFLNLREDYHINRNHDCKECPVKYWCLGGCRGETYENTLSLNSKSITCKDNFAAIIETFWYLSELN